MRAREFIFEGYKEVEAKFVASGADPAQVKQSIQKYRDLINKNQFKDNEANIDWWGKNKTFQDFVDAVELKLAVPTKRQEKKITNVGNSINLYEDNNWLVVIPLDKDASCFHGKGSDWCTTKRNQQHFKEYFHDQNIILIYCLNKASGGMWAIANYRNVYEPEEEDEVPIELPVDDLGNPIDYELFDQQDNKLTPEQFKQQTGLDPFNLMDLSDAQAGHNQPIGQAQSARRKTISQTSRQINTAVKRDPMIEKALYSLDNPQMNFNYIKRLGSRKVDLSGLPEKILVSASEREAGGRSESILKYIPNAPDKIKILSIKHQRTAIKDLIDNGVMPTEEQLLQSNLGLMAIGDDIKLLHDNNLITPKLERELKHNNNAIKRLLELGYEFSDKDIESALTMNKEGSYDSPAHVSTAAMLIAATGYWPSTAAFKNIAKTETFYDVETKSFKPYYHTSEKAEQAVIDKLREKSQDAIKNLERYNRLNAERQETIQNLEQQISSIQQDLERGTSFGNYRKKDELASHKRNLDMYLTFIEETNQQIKILEKQNLNISKILRRYDRT